MICNLQTRFSKWLGGWPQVWRRGRRRCLLYGGCEILGIEENRREVLRGYSQGCGLLTLTSKGTVTSMVWTCVCSSSWLSALCTVAVVTSCSWRWTSCRGDVLISHRLTHRCQSTQRWTDHPLTLIGCLSSLWHPRVYPMMNRQTNNCDQRHNYLLIILASSLELQPSRRLIRLS